MQPEYNRNHAEKTVESNPKLAVIDDEYRWLKVFERMFRNTVYHLDTYSDPLIFLDVIKNDPERYAGVICDIKMPQITGYQVFDRLKANPATADLPFVLVSGVLTQDHNLYRVQGIAYISKLDDDLRSKIFDELIEIIEKWPLLKDFFQQCQVPASDIAFFQQFYANYHLFFSQILGFVRNMEAACVKEDAEKTAQIYKDCTRYMNNLHQRCMHLIQLANDCPYAGHFVSKVCTRARTSLNMLLMFQMQLADSAPPDSDFPALLNECRNSLEKIILGSEKGFNLRGQE